MDFHFDHLGLSGLSQMDNLHPMWVHFPVALLPLALLFYVVGVVSDRGPMLIAGRWVLVLTALASGISVWTGTRAVAEIIEKALLDGRFKFWDQRW